ncbi:BTB/POZ domain protein [Penicillium manginii]|uniref:BTB/POZ domain protein n=1 Tax=Penicillium manginii TaxID=203109 RepID=UPI002546EE16|nr:BTB/POZ domain protein [Penicillium manginii]KAJ5763910.1 BTB/POZ domain protein [Penicillium manginii]
MPTRDIRSFASRISEEPDITISCGEDNHKVHRAIISLKSEVLAAMCRRGTFIEDETGVINLRDDDPEAVNIMVQHIYDEPYKISPQNKKDESSARLSLQVYAIADKYMIEPLAVSARNEFKSWAAMAMCTDSWARIVEEIWEGDGYSGLYPAIEKLIAGDIDYMLGDEWRPFIDKGMRFGRFSTDFLRGIVEKKDFDAYEGEGEGEALFEMGKFEDLEKKIDGLEYTVSNLEHAVKGLENTIKDLDHTIKSRK